VTEKAAEAALTIPHPQSFENLRGKGVKVHADGKVIVVGGSELLEGEGIDIPNRREPSSIQRNPRE